jgi:DNA-binding helix-hairpin-helix protein with protein kinase domain
VAKIYARRPDEALARKLRAMVALRTDELASVAAWPHRLLLDRGSGAVVGFLMARVEGHREVHALYGPTARRDAFPDAGWAFLVRVARNLAAAFDAVHRHGHVVGDVNQGNVLVSRKATVRLIDCDSFQVTHRGHTYPCRVGVPLFTPPELSGLRLESVARTQDHDRFGLAVLVFQMLFTGRHPFAGPHPDRAVPVEAAIREGVFAFGQQARREGWEPPPFSLRLDDVTPPVATLFERAFGRDAAAGGPRPSAREWVGALDALEAQLVLCGDDPRHAYARATGPCPWCRIGDWGGPSYFFLPQGSAADAFDLAATWRAVEAVPSPGEAPVPGAPGPGTPAVERRPGALLRVRLAVDGLLAPRVAALERGRAERRAREIEGARDRVRRIEEQWRSRCGEAAFAARRSLLERARASLEGLEATESRGLEPRQATRRASLLATLRSGPLFLAEIRRQTLVWRQTLGPALDDAHRELARLETAAPGCRFGLADSLSRDPPATR